MASADTVPAGTGSPGDASPREFSQVTRTPSAATDYVIEDENQILIYGSSREANI